MDTESGEFDFDSATGSFAGFRIGEELANIGTTEAVGRTGEVSGEMTIADSTLTATEVTVEVSTLTSDRPRRDDRMHEALGTGQFPEATFEAHRGGGARRRCTRGRGRLGGRHRNLTIHGVTNEVTAKLQARLTDGTAVVVGSIPVTLADYDIDAPGSPVVLSVSDEATVEFQLLFVPA
ncbi:MAG: YceI family protein [Microthrixaceae bacterium]|nr:YceI family protein [Microthrixaceae bacterium]